MNYTLPYFGKKGTISNITENNKKYSVYRYGTKKNEKYLLEVPKNKKNEELLIENYYNDLLEYLNINKEKYDKYKNKKEKKTININLLKIIGILMLTSSVPLLKTYGILGYLGVALDALSIPVILSVIKLSIDDKETETEKKFINKYDELKHRLRIYNEKQEKNHIETKYSKLVKEEKEPKRDINKKLEKKKVA